MTDSLKLLRGMMIMAKSYRQRVNDSFSDSDHEDLAKYFDWLLDSFKSASQNIRRTVTLALFLIAIFEIIAQSPKTQINLLQSFQLSRNSLVFTFLPALVAYLYLQMIFDTIRLDRMSYTYEAAFKRWSSKASDNDLDLWISPTQPIYWNIGGAVSSHRAAYDKIEVFAVYCLWFLILLGVLGFEVQAFYILFNANLSKDIPWFISVSISFSFILCTASYTIAYMLTNEEGT
jgi:hypothetical protein